MSWRRGMRCVRTRGDVLGAAGVSDSDATGVSGVEVELLFVWLLLNRRLLGPIR